MTEHREDIVERLTTLFRTACNARFDEGAEEREGGSDGRAERAYQRHAKAEEQFNAEIASLRTRLEETTGERIEGWMEGDELLDLRHDLIGSAIVHNAHGYPMDDLEEGQRAFTLVLRAVLPTEGG